MSASPMILDEQMPSFDVTIARHLVIDADPDTVWHAAHDLDFMTVHSPLLDASMWVRGLPGRLRGRPPSRPERLTLATDSGLPGWLPLGERAGEEIAFGAVGRFWQGTISWKDVSLADFASFAEPGYGKIACNFTVRPYGARRTLLTYECRTAISDPESRRKFARYWRGIWPFVSHIMAATLQQVSADALWQVTARPAVPVG